MVGDGRAPVRQGVKPDFVGTGGVATELETEPAEPVHDLAVAKTREATH